MTNRLSLKRLLFNLASLANLGQEVTSSKEFPEKMRTALYVVTGMFSVPKAAVLTFDADRGCLELLTSKGLPGAENIRLCITARETARFPRNGPWALRDLRNTAFGRRNRAVWGQLEARTFIPLYVKDAFVGAMTLGKRLNRTSFLRSERDVLTVIAHQMAITLQHAELFQELTEKVAENQRLYENMRHIYYDTVRAFAAAIDAKDGYTKDHSSRVARYAVAIARELGWSEEEVEGIYIAGLLHDIGKIIIDSGVINKGETLTQQERDAIRKHPEISYEILTKIKLPWKDVVTFIRHHHERPDGSGYPDSLAAPDLSDGVKILALADAFDAMTTDRPYREKRSLAEAFREIRRGIGTQFDRRITDVFLKLMEKNPRGVLQEVQLLSDFHGAEESRRDIPGLVYDA